MSYSCAAVAKQAKRRGLLSTQCTIQGQNGCPQESHLIFSCLHGINLPPQCYSSTGHSSSFRERGIDQAGLCNAFVCVMSTKRMNKTFLHCIQYIISVLCTYIYCMCMRECLCKVSVCVLQMHKQQDTKCVYVYTIVSLFAYGCVGS